MAAKVISFRLSNSTVALLDKATKRSHMTRTAIVDYAISILAKEIETGTVRKHQLGERFWSNCDMSEYVRNKVIDAFQGC